MYTLGERCGNGIVKLVFVSETNPLDLIGSLAKGVDLLVLLGS